MLPRLTNLKKQLFPRVGNFGDKILIPTFSEVHFRKGLTFSKVKLPFGKIMRKTDLRIIERLAYLKNCTNKTIATNTRIIHE